MNFYAFFCLSHNIICENAEQFLLKRKNESLNTKLSEKTKLSNWMEFHLHCAPASFSCRLRSSFPNWNDINTLSRWPKYHFIDFSFFLCSSPLSDYANRGTKKFGDKCESTEECGFPGSVCDSKKKSCQCIEELPITNHLDKCGKGK